MKAKTFEEAVLEVLPYLDDPVEVMITRGDSAEAGDAIGKSKEAIAFLKKTLSADIKRYFSATNDTERDQIKGAFRRTIYLLGLALPKENVDTMKTKLSGKRKPVKDLQ